MPTPRSRRERMGREEPLRFRFRQRAGGFVHDEDVGAAGERLGNLDELLGRDRQVGHVSPRIERNAQLLAQDLGRGVLQLSTIQPAQPIDRLTRQEDVLRDRKVRNQREFLVNDGDAVALRVARSVEPDGAALESDGSGVIPIRPGQDLDQRALAGPRFRRPGRGSRPAAA